MKDRLRVAVYNPSLHLGGGGEKYAVAVAEALSSAHEVHLFSRETVDLAELGAHFGADLSACSFHLLPGANLPMKAALRFRAPNSVYWSLRDQRYYQWFKKQAFDVFVTVCFDSLMPCPSPLGLYTVMFPTKLTAQQRRGSLRSRLGTRLGLPTGAAALDTHDVWMVISEFADRWTHAYWGKHETKLLYPRCDDLTLLEIGKRKVILNVGRFFDLAENNEHHHKRQDALVEVFKGLSDLHVEGWELHLAGAVADVPRHRKALEDLSLLAGDAPVVLHPNASFDELRRLNNEASIYWHATGFGSDAETNPGAQEHFGISVVEAMSTGAVPLVYGTAGPAETVEDGVQGRHWFTVDDLAARTRELASDDALRARLSANARERARDFDGTSFARRLNSILEAAQTESRLNGASKSRRLGFRTMRRTTARSEDGPA